jgi:hypothetical protein
MLEAPAGGVADRPCVCFLPQALPRQPAPSSALSARLTASGEPLRSIVVLLGAYGYPGGQAAVTQPNLIALDDKIAATAGGSSGDDLYTRSLRLGAPDGWLTAGLTGSQPAGPGHRRVPPQVQLRGL